MGSLAYRALGQAREPARRVRVEHSTHGLGGI
jgi:hypothetical protein